MSLKQKKIKFRPRIKLNHNVSMERWGENNVVATKKIILICFDCASRRVQPTVPTFSLLSHTDQSNNSQLRRTGNNNDSITIINNNNNNNNNNIYDNNRSNWPFRDVVTMEVYHHLHNRLRTWSIRSFSKNMRISNLAKYTIKSRLPGDKTAPLAVSFEYSL